MLCPRCRTEYPTGVLTCSKCGIDLVAELPDEGPDLVSVFEAGDHVELAVARSLLEAEGIECETQGEAGQEVFGLGPLPGATGTVRLLVAHDDAAAARALLAARKEPTTPDTHAERKGTRAG